jgi:peptide deformylase
MAILKVAQLGHPVLRAKARPVDAEDLRDPAFQRLIDDMIETMREYDGVGLAAPQVHVSKRLAVIESHRNPRYPDAPEFPLSVLVNPVLTPLTDEPFEWWEGCLSIPGLRGLVRRPARVRVEALDREGRPFAREVEGFTATVHQHEVDHLDGVVFLDRMQDLSALSFEREYARFHAPAAPDGGEEDEDDEAGEP